MRKCFKSLLVAMLALVMLIPTALPAAADNSYGFKDFPTGWSAPAMSHAVANGIIYGKTSDRIAPEDNLTRAEMATIINRAFGATVKGDISKFTDVDPSAWYYEEIQKAYNMQTLYGDAGNTMRPDAPIIREEAIAIVARAMVLSGYSASNLDKFKDKGEIADWAIDSLASMTANGYVNGDETSKVNPKANITREEFAQLIYNIIKHYYNPNAKSDEYQGNLMLNKPDISLENITVNGDLILGDGVGTSKITLTNITIKGRLLVRGAAQITLKDVTTGKGVVVKNVNGTVHFDNYRDEKVFDGVAEHTKVTYKQRSGGGGGGGSTPAPSTAAYKVEHYQEDLEGNFNLYETENLSGRVGSNVTATAKTYEGFSEDTANVSRVASGRVTADGALTLKLYYTRKSYNVTFNYGEAGGQNTVSFKYGATVPLEAPLVTAPAGKYFAGWYDAPVGGTQYTTLTVPVGGVTIYAQWSDVPPAVVNFTVKHLKENLDGTYTEAETETESALENTTVKAVDYAKTYEGFSVNAGLSVDVVVLSDGTSVLNIYYTRNSYDVTFNFGEAGGQETVSLKYGESINLGAPSVTAPAGKYFVGWFDAADGGTQYTDLTVPVGGVTIYAQWATISYTDVDFTVEHYQQNTDGTYPVVATESETKSATAGTLAEAADYAKTYTGFTFDDAASSDITVSAGAVLKIYYTRNTYTFVFNYEGATSGNTELSKTYSYGESITGLPVPSKGEQYGFGGWYTEPNGAGTKIEGDILGTVITADSTDVYAYWIQKYPYTVKYLQENANDNDFTVVVSDTKTLYGFENEVVTVTNDKSYTGFYYDTTSVTTGTVNIAGSLVIELKFKRETYTVTYNYGEAGGEGTVTLKYGQNVDLSTPSVTAPTDKYFAGWYDAATDGNKVTSLETPIGGTTIYAQWSDNPSYTVKHYKEKLDGTGYDVETDYIQADKDATVTAVAGTFTGFVYSHGDNGATGTNDGNLVFELYYNRVRYTVTFETNGGSVVADKEYKYEEPFELPVTTKEGYEVEGWYTSPTFDASTKVETGDTAGNVFGDGPLYVKWSPVPVNFTVKHNKEALDGTYATALTETKQALTESTVSAADYDKTYEGFTFDSSASADVTIAADGTSVLEIYYTRNSYEVTYNYGEAGGSNTVSYKFEEAVDLSIPSVTAPANKYFAGWFDAETGGNKVTSIETPVGGTTIYAQWSINPSYTVKHYKEKLDGTGYDVETDYIQADKDATVTAVARTFTGFVYSHGDNGATGTNDGNLVFELYYNRERYTVTFETGEGTPVASKEYKYEEPFTVPSSEIIRYGETIYESNGWWTGANGTGNQITSGSVAGVDFETVTLYPTWNYVWAGEVKFVAEVTDEDLDNDTFYVTVSIDNNPVGISKYELSLSYDNANVVAVLDGGKVVTDLHGLGGAAITTNADSVITESDAADLNTITVAWNNSANVAGNEELFKIKFKIIGTKEDEDLEASAGGASMFAMRRVISLIDGLESLPFTLVANEVVTKAVDGSDIPVENTTEDDGLEPYAIQHYKENAEDDGYTKVYTQYGHDILGNEVTAQYRDAYLRAGFTKDVNNNETVDSAVLAEGGAILKLFYLRQRYTVNFDYQGATVKPNYNSVELKFGQKVKDYLPAESAIEKTDYNFAGWYTQPNGEGTKVGDAYTVPANGVTLYAHWIQTPYRIEHWFEELDGSYKINSSYTELKDAKAGTVVTATAKTGILGFEFDVDNTNNVMSKVLEADPTDNTKVVTVLKVYYNRKVYTINYDFAGGTAVGSYETTFKYGQSIPLANAEKPGMSLLAWTTKPNGGGTQVRNTANIDSILRNLTGNELKLYAFWIDSQLPTATFEVEHYKENLDGTYPASATETDDEDEITVGSMLEVADYAKTYEGFTVDTSMSFDVDVDAVDHYVLKIYYKRNVYTLNYNYCDADTTGVASNTFKYGQTITLPEDGTYTKEGFIPTGWYKTDAYNEDDLVDESVYIQELLDPDSDTEATIYVKWDQFFTVTFKELGILRHTSKVYPGEANTVPQTDIDTAYNGLVNPYLVGYYKDATVSSVYADDPYEHRLYGNWYYYEDGEYILFTDETVVDRDMTVRYMFRKAGLELNIDKLSQIIDPTFEVPFENDTTVVESVKDATFLFEEKILTALNALGLGDKFDVVNDKIVELLAAKGFKVTPGRLIADDGEILYQHVEFNAFAYIDEATLEKIVVEAITTTFKNDPLRMRGVIDEMMKEKDPQVIDVMDSMLVSMLSGSDSARIKGIIAEAVVKAVEEDTTGEFKNKIISIITSSLDAEAENGYTGEKVVTNSVKDAIYDYFNNSANDAEIEEIVSGLVEDAFATDDETDPVRVFVKKYITDYLDTPAGSAILGDMIKTMGETLDKNNPDDQPIIDLIHDVLDENVPYLEQLVDDAIVNLKDYAESDPLYIFIVDAIKSELTNNPAELETLINEISNADVASLKSVLVTVMQDDGIFTSVVTDAMDEEDIFTQVIETALDNTDVFDAIIRELCEEEPAFYNMLVDVALSSTTLTNEVKEAVIDNDDALIKVIKEIASDATLKEEIIDELMAAGDDELKAQLTSPLDPSSDYYNDVKAQALAQAEEEIISIIEAGINEVDHPEYWPVAFEKAMEVAEAQVRQDLIANSVDPNGSLWNTLYAEAMAQAAINVTAELNGGITDASDYYVPAVNGAKEVAADEIDDLLTTGIAEGSKYWDIAYDTAKAIARDNIVADFDDKIDEIKTNEDSKSKVKDWAAGAINEPEVEDAIKDLAKDLADSTDPEDAALKASIIDTVITTVANSNQVEKENLVDDIVDELLKPANSDLKDIVTEKAIEVLNKPENEDFRNDLIEDVIEDILENPTLKGQLIGDLIAKVNDPDEAAFKNTVIEEAIKAVKNDATVNQRAVEIINDRIEDPAQAAFKADIIEHIVDYILENDDVRADAMDKVVEMIEDPDNTAHKEEAIEFAFKALKTRDEKREEITENFIGSILGNADDRAEMATEVIDIMFSNPALRDEILDIGFEQMFSDTDAIAEVVELAIDELINDDEVRRDMILAVIETDSGRDSILDILFDELERDDTLLDKIVDLAMAGKYGDMVDLFVYDLVNNGKIQINPDNRQITEEIILPMLDDMTLDTIMSKIPAQISNVLPESVIGKIFNKFKSKARENLVEGIEEAKQGNSKDIKVMIDHELDVVNAILVPAYNKVFPRITDKAEDFYYYNENQYIKAIVDMLDPEYIFDHTQPASEMGTGYRIRDSRYYYEMYRNTLILADDAGQWYADHISDEQIDKVISKFMNAYTTVITKVNSVAGGKIPTGKLNTVMNKAVNLVEKAIDKTDRAYHVTTNGSFEVVDSAYHKIIAFVKEKIGTDLSTDTVIEVTFDGSNLTLNDDKSINIDNYDINVKVKGYSFALNSHYITVGGKTVDISRFVQKVANTFGTRSVTIKFSEEVPYSYEFSVGNNSVKLSAFYEG